MKGDDGLFSMPNRFKELIRYRGLLYALTVREVKVRYKQSLLGIGWAILQPLVLMLIFTLIFSMLTTMPSDNIPYPIFSYSALLPWTFFATSINFTSQSIVNNAALIKKIYFPRELFPISGILAAFVDFAIAAMIFLGMMFFYKVPFTTNLLFFPAIFLIQIIFTLGVSFFLSAINVYYRDIRYAVPLGVQIWMYASPIIYPISLIPERLRTLYMLNPMASIIDSYRNVFIKGIAPDFYYLDIAALVSLILFFLCYIYFKRIEMTFADVI